MYICKIKHRMWTAELLTATKLSCMRNRTRGLGWILHHKHNKTEGSKARETIFNQGPLASAMPERPNRDLGSENSSFLGSSELAVMLFASQISQ